MKAIELNINSLNSTDSKLGHITQEERQTGFTEVDKLKQYLFNAENLQKTVPKWENAVVSANDIRKQINDVTEKVKKVMSKPLPPPPKPEKKE